MIEKLLGIAIICITIVSMAGCTWASLLIGHRDKYKKIRMKK